MDEFMRGMEHAITILRLHQEREGGRGSYIKCLKQLTEAMQVINDLTDQHDLDLSRPHIPGLVPGMISVIPGGIIPNPPSDWDFTSSDHSDTYPRFTGEVTV